MLRRRIPSISSVSLTFGALAACGGPQVDTDPPDVGGVEDESRPVATPRPYTQSAASLATGGTPVTPRPDGPDLRQLEEVMRNLCEEWDRCGYFDYGYYGYYGQNQDDPVEQCVRSRVDRYDGSSYRSDACNAAWMEYYICQYQGVRCANGALRYDYNANCYQLYDAIDRECYDYHY